MNFIIVPIWLFFSFQITQTSIFKKTPTKLHFDRKKIWSRQSLARTFNQVNDAGESKRPKCRPCRPVFGRNRRQAGWRDSRPSCVASEPRLAHHAKVSPDIVRFFAQKWLFFKILCVKFQIHLFYFEFIADISIFKKYIWQI